VPESSDRPQQSDPEQDIQPVAEFGDPIEIPEFKDASFLNGLFLTLLEFYNIAMNRSATTGNSAN
jgi:hypothetical protein